MHYHVYWNKKSFLSKKIQTVEKPSLRGQNYHKFCPRQFILLPKQPRAFRDPGLRLTAISASCTALLLFPSNNQHLHTYGLIDALLILTTLMIEAFKSIIIIKGTVHNKNEF